MASRVLGLGLGIGLGSGTTRSCAARRRSARKGQRLDHRAAGDAAPRHRGLDALVLNPATGTSKKVFDHRCLQPVKRKRATGVLTRGV